MGVVHCEPQEAVARGEEVVPVDGGVAPADGEVAGGAVDLDAYVILELGDVVEV